MRRTFLSERHSSDVVFLYQRLLLALYPSLFFFFLQGSYGQIRSTPNKSRAFPLLLRPQCFLEDQQGLAATSGSCGRRKGVSNIHASLSAPPSEHASLRWVA
ncbi:hypothetical protein F5B20DRAFT_494946 [Whalleya microplaca]|nr:hypothetical protein F5B20DRAFT_494946 [Whalleya microplaca]